MSRTTSDYRKAVIAFLCYLSDVETPERIEKDHGASPAEFFRLWFEEIYAPSKRYLECPRGDFSESEADRFRSSFSTEELAALERFHRFLELRLAISERENNVLEIFRKRWGYIRRDAELALTGFEIDIDERSGEYIDEVKRRYSVSSSK